MSSKPPNDPKTPRDPKTPKTRKPPKPPKEDRQPIDSKEPIKKWGTFSDVIRQLDNPDDLLLSDPESLQSFRFLAAVGVDRDKFVEEVKRKRETRVGKPGAKKINKTVLDDVKFAAQTFKSLRKERMKENARKANLAETQRREEKDTMEAAPADSMAGGRMISWDLSGNIDALQSYGGGQEPGSESRSGTSRRSYSMDQATQSMATMGLTNTAADPRAGSHQFPLPPLRGGRNILETPLQPLAFHDPSPAEQSTVQHLPPRTNYPRPPHLHSSLPQNQVNPYASYGRNVVGENTEGAPSTTSTSQRARTPPIFYGAENRRPSPVPIMGAMPGPSSHGAPRAGQGSQSSSDHPAQPNASGRKSVPMNADTILGDDIPEPRTRRRATGVPSDASTILRHKSSSPESQGNAKKQKK